MKPQCQDILLMLMRGPVTQQDAIREARCYRLAARISDLRAAGYRIDSELVTAGGVRFARYRLADTPVQMAAFG